MKNFLLMIFAIFFCSTTQVLMGAQQDKENILKTMSISVEPVLLLLGVLDVKFQHRTSKRTALVADAITHVFWPPMTAKLANISELFGIGGGLGIKITPFNSIFENGFYLLPSKGRI